MIVIAILAVGLAVGGWMGIRQGRRANTANIARYLAWRDL